MWFKVSSKEKRKWFKNINITPRVKKTNKTKYVHPSQISGMYQWVDEIVEQLNAATVIAGKFKTNSCEVEQFMTYKKVFHDLWLGVADQYNNINNLDIDKCSDMEFIA